MLDLQNDGIKCLLPYLLSAYTCHSVRNRLVNGKSLDIIFGFTEELKTQQLSRRKKDIKTLSEKFSFSTFKEIKTQPPKTISDERPYPFIADRGNISSLYHNIHFINHIFSTWFVAIRETCRSEIYKDSPQIKDIYNCIKLKDNYLLFLHYTKQEIPSRFSLDSESDDSAFENQIYHEFLLDSITSM